MRLDKVEIVGFKSFCDKQELDFKGGVTGIVGPNGCGKSNISDAISWVLGEQSAKSLRGASMDDVIFAGSQSRQPVGMAEVNLKVSGLNGNSPDGSPECVITRRLYRDGTSEYLMNGGVCRLRDIHELFMDTGLGSKAYSIIEQGKIGQILSTKPADRRALIEEAAGITKYRVRRRQTALKLDAAQQNLLRVNDIIHEVEKQLDSLKRQASKARRYRALREEMQGVEHILFGLRYLALAESARGLGERLAAEGAREQAAAIALSTEEARTEARRNELYQEEARLEEARKSLAETTLAVDRHHGRSGYCKEQAREAATRADQARQEAGELESRVAPLLDELGARQGEERTLRDQLAAAEEEARGAETAVQACARRLADGEAALDAARDEQVTTMGRIAALQNARESASNAAERAGADLLKLASESQELERERGQLDAARHAALAREREAEALAAALAGRRNGALAETSQARERADSLGREADLLESERDGLAGRLSSLEEMVATHSAFDEGVRALLAGPEGVQVLGVVADCVETDSAHERAVEAFMGDRLQTLLTPNAGAAAGCIRFLRDSGAGRATILPLAWSHAETVRAPLRELAVREARATGLVSDLYRVTGPHAERIRASLPDGLVMESLDDALDLQSRHPGIPCVSMGGDTVRAGLIEGGRGVRGLLAPRREIREIGARLAEIGWRLSSARGQEAEEASRAEATSAEARTLEESIHAAEKDLVAIRHDLAVAEEETSRVLRKATVLETERSLAEQERSAAAVRLGEIEEALQLAEERRGRGSEQLAAATSAMGEARSASETAQERSAEARSRLAALRERVVAAEAECRRLSEDHTELLGRIAAARARVEEMEQRGSELTAEIGECERLLAEALNERDRGTREAAAIEDVVRDMRNELEARELAMKEGRRQRDTLRQTVSELEVAQARIGSDLDHLARECQQAVGLTAAEAAAALGEEDQAREAADLEAQLAELREKLERMGPVNVLAVEQAQELEDRDRFMTAQRQDLLDSIAEMERAIKTIDRTSRERFQDAFQVINQHFGEVFKQLFGGGTAGLSLIDEEDLLESGIDVMAQPPGKRLQNVMLLSGGEKALTAIALLFAIFQYKPSPFCILDEVDAPLDDANIGRFVRMLEGLKDQTQFVLITHSRRTMQIADQLYGVTMEEPGVSKLVSVRFT